MKKHILTILIGFIFLIGLSVLLYPFVSNYINERNASFVMQRHDEAVSALTQEECAQQFALASQYNRALRDGPLTLKNGQSEDVQYTNLLNIEENGVMGYLEIEKIRVFLPIYHGTSEEVLKKSVGHIEGSFLPIGEQGSHALLSGHRGLPSAKLLTDLDQLQLEDTFSLTILNRKFTYQVDEIKTIAPTDLTGFEAVPNKDYVTLITCTPYGVNTHRLLIRGVRIADEAVSSQSLAVLDPVSFDYLPAVCVVLLLAIPILAIRLIQQRKKRK